MEPVPEQVQVSEPEPGPTPLPVPRPRPGMLACPLCLRLLWEPVTAACGHSLCRGCGPGGPSPRCPVCREPLVGPGWGSRVNVLLRGLLHNWCPGPGTELGPSPGGGRSQPPHCAPDDGQSGPSPAEETVGVQVAGDRLDNLELECRRITEGVENLSLAATDCVQGAGVSLTQGAGVSLTQDVSSGQWPIVLQPMEKETTNKLSAEGLSNPGYVEETVVSCSHCPQSVPPALLNISDFDCSLCTRLLFEPVTTPCGHTFCRKCVERCLDYRPRCPLCKEDLRKFLQQRQYPVTQLLNSIITVYFPTEFAERKLLNEREMAELSNLTSNVAIFVCTVAFPGSPCPLHVFEPRYRLMIRQCLETGTKTFGMCVYEPGKIFADYGCMLKIRGSEDLPDGRSLIDTVGGRRFKVLRRSRRDGYNTADVEYLEDKRVEGEELTRLLPFHNRVYEQARDWFDHLPSRFQEQITGHHGSMPDQEENIQASQDGPRWLWWLLAIVPMDPALQTVVLSSTSLNERLIHLQRVLEYLAQNPIQ